MGMKYSKKKWAFMPELPVERRVGILNEPGM